MATVPRNGAVMPAEFSRHERTVMCWPAREELYGDLFAEAERAHAEVARTISQFEPVTVIADQRHIERAAKIVGDGVDVVEMPIDDSWFRDSGPIYVRDESGAVLATSWTFNGWGGKFSPISKDVEIASRYAMSRGDALREIPMVLEGGSLTVNGDGVLVTTMQCLLHPNRNPHLSKRDIEDRLRDELGARSIMWLPHGLELDDDTDGHVDNVAAFASTDHLLLQGCDDPGKADHARMAINAKIAEDFRTHDGTPLRTTVVPVLPFTEVNGTTVVVPYLNFYVGNGFVLVPTCGHEADDDMVAFIGEQFPGRTTIGLDVGAVLAVGGGGIHCITQQVPAVSATSPH